jgi:hypothetical protein
MRGLFLRRDQVAVDHTARREKDFGLSFQMARDQPYFS